MFDNYSVTGCTRICGEPSELLWAFSICRETYNPLIYFHLIIVRNFSVKLIYFMNCSIYRTFPSQNIFQAYRYNEFVIILQKTEFLYENFCCRRRKYFFKYFEISQLQCMVIVSIASKYLVCNGVCLQRY